MKNILIIGATGEIGFSLYRLFNRQPNTQNIFLTMRDKEKFSQLNSKSKLNDDTDSANSLSKPVHLFEFDHLNEASWESFSNELKRQTDRIDLVIVASGILAPVGKGPEKSSRQLSFDQMEYVFRVNTILPSMAIKYTKSFQRSSQHGIFCALSAMVGSIEENEVGGWYSYRASKTALNMILKTYSIEMAMNNKNFNVFAIHPGTTKTNLSENFLKGIKQNCGDPSCTRAKYPFQPPPNAPCHRDL